MGCVCEWMCVCVYVCRLCNFITVSISLFPPSHTLTRMYAHAHEHTHTYAQTLARTHTYTHSTRWGRIYPYHVTAENAITKSHAAQDSIITWQHARKVVYTGTDGQHIRGERTTKGRVRECLFEFVSCVGGCICMSTPQRFVGDTATSLKWGEQYYCHHRGKGYYLAKPNLAVTSRLAPNQIFARPRTVWKIRWEDGDSTDTYERPISKFIVVNARSTDLVANNVLAF